MPIRALHVVESLEPRAGSVAVCLRELPKVLRPTIESETVTADGSGTDGLSPGTLHDLDRFDVVHIHGWGTDLTRDMATLSRKRGKPYIISPLGSLTYGPYRRRTFKDRLRWTFGEKALVRSASDVTAVNERERGALRNDGVQRIRGQSWYGVDFAEYRKDPDEFVLLPDPLDGRCLLMLGPIHPIEGCVVLLKAFAELGRDTDGWHVVLAGHETGAYRHMLEAAVRRKGGTDRVMFAEAPDIPTQRAWLKRASIVAVPRLHLGLSASIIQAIASGVPVLATDLVAPPLVDGVIRVCGPSRFEIKEALRSMVKLSDDERTAIAEQARETGRTIYDSLSTSFLSRYTSLYEAVV